MNGFSWIIEGEIGGMPRPGQDQDALWRWLSAQGVRLCSESVSTAIDGGTGEIAIKLTIKPMAGDEMGIELKDEIKPKVPRRQTGKTIFFATEDGGLTRSDPRQPELPMQVVSKGKAG